MEENDKPGKFKENLILRLSFEFALKIIEYSEILEEKRKFAIANQVLRSGTSIGANVREAQGPKSKADFINKMKTAYQEADETEYWLLLCKHSKNYPEPGNLIDEVKVLLKILGKIIASSKS